MCRKSLIRLRPRQTPNLLREGNFLPFTCGLALFFIILFPPLVRLIPLSSERVNQICDGIYTLSKWWKSFFVNLSFLWLLIMRPSAKVGRIEQCVPKRTLTLLRLISHPWMLEVNSKGIISSIFIVFIFFWTTSGFVITSGLLIEWFCQLRWESIFLNLIIVTIIGLWE